MRLRIAITLLIILWVMGYTSKPLADPVASRENPEEKLEAEISSDAAPPKPSYPDISITINLPARILTLRKDGAIVKQYPVSIGELRYKSPVMSDQITQIIWNPWWIPPDSPWARGSNPQPPGPNNCLGPVKMLLGQGVRIHGTNKPSSVGRPSSHGCFRMHNEDAVEVAWFLQTNLSSLTDESYRAKYAKNRYQSFYVKLDFPARAEIIYKPVEFTNDTLIVYPDIYSWAKDYTREIAVALIEGGITPEHINQEKIKELKINGRNRDKMEIPVSEVLSEKPLYQPASATSEGAECKAIHTTKRKHHPY